MLWVEQPCCFDPRRGGRGSGRRAAFSQGHTGDSGIQVDGRRGEYDTDVEGCWGKASRCNSRDEDRSCEEVWNGWMFGESKSESDRDGMTSSD